MLAMFRRFMGILLGEVKGDLRWSSDYRAGYEMALKDVEAWVRDWEKGSIQLEAARASIAATERALAQIKKERS